MLSQVPEPQVNIAHIGKINEGEFFQISKQATGLGNRPAPNGAPGPREASPMRCVMMEGRDGACRTPLTAPHWAAAIAT
jgi:hypothetical protein